MSAFLCSDRHVAVVSLLAHSCGYVLGDEAGFMTALRRANNAALAHRYGDAPAQLRNRVKALEAGRKWLAANPSNAARLCVIECLQYQCSEGETLDINGKHALVAVTLESMRRMLDACAQGQTSHVWSI